MTTLRSKGRFTRGAAVLLATLTLGASCSEGRPAVENRTESVLEAREVLGQPMLRLAEAVISLSNGIDDARHEVRRGSAMARALPQLRQRKAAVDDAVRAADAAAEEVKIELAREIVSGAAQTALEASAAAKKEIAFLRRVSALDTALLAGASTWDQPGSQSELRARLAGVADDMAALRSAARSLRPVPAPCQVMRTNRVEWVATVRSRTQKLQSLANSTGGTEFDRRRSAYRPLPLAVEPRTADRQDRGCWQEESGVARGAEAMRRAVEELRTALS